MKKIFAIAALIFGVSTQAVLAEPQTYKFDPNHTEVLFSYQHLGMSRAYGQFNKLDGIVKMDKAKPENSLIDVNISAKSIDSGVKTFDTHLQGKDFFDVAKYPTLKFKSTNVKKITDKKFKVLGDLTIKGKTKPVTLDVTYIIDQPHPMGAFNPKMKDVYVAAFSAKASVKRSEFGLGKFAPAVSDKVDIIIETEMFRQ